MEMFASYDDAWRLNEEVCPCDIQFIEYIALKKISNNTIFHFGTGLHHIVGTADYNQRCKNTVIGVTASIPEYQAYMDLVMKKPVLSVYYKAIFCDIYTLSRVQLPSFDIVTLFHLCEYYSERNSYAPLDDEGLLSLMIEKTLTGGQLAFYTGSNGFQQTRQLVANAVDHGQISPSLRYKLLQFYRRN